MEGEERKRNPLVVIFLLVLIIGAAGSMLGLTYIYANHHTARIVAAEFDQSGEDLDNPYCGWYRIYYYDLGKGGYDVSSVADSYRNDRNNLALLEIDISSFRNRDLSAAGIKTFEDILHAWELSGKNIILRVLYDVNGDAQNKEPGSLEQVKAHMEQVAEIVNAHTDLIYIMQGIFVGDYAEMHGGSYMGLSDMKDLTRQLQELIDPSIFLSVRTPQQYRIINETMEPITEEQAFDGSLASRLGLYNDGMTGSETDLGTYSETAWDDEDRTYNDKGDRNQELIFQNGLCRFVPNGGEAVVVSKYNDFMNAVSAFSTMHVSYLDCDYDAAVLNKWKNYTMASDDVFDGNTGYEYIQKHLGYRYYIDDISVTMHGLLSSDATITLSVGNSGFSTCYMPLTWTVTVLGEDKFTQVWTTELEEDSRYFDTGVTNEAVIDFAIDDLGKGDYTLYLNVTDPATGRSIALDNVNEAADTYQETFGLYLGELILDEDK